jgi:hypothetical protein
MDFMKAAIVGKDGERFAGGGASQEHRPETALQ